MAFSDIYTDQEQNGIHDQGFWSSRFACLLCARKGLSWPSAWGACWGGGGGGWVTAHDMLQPEFLIEVSRCPIDHLCPSNEWFDRMHTNLPSAAGPPASSTFPSAGLAHLPTRMRDQTQASLAIPYQHDVMMHQKPVSNPFLTLMDLSSPSE